jgi:hypothetical protein
MATWRRRALDVFPDLRHDLNSPDYPRRESIDSAELRVVAGTLGIPPRRDRGRTGSDRVRLAYAKRPCGHVVA